MAGEPWCMAPAEIAALTDWQIEDVYLKPALERQEAAERERKGLPPEPPADAEPLTGPPPRAAVVGIMTGMLGMSVQAANAEYDRQVAEWEASRGNRAS